jgi:hypothetical protein
MQVDDKPECSRPAVPQRGFVHDGHTFIITAADPDGPRPLRPADGCPVGAIEYDGKRHLVVMLPPASCTPATPRLQR